MTNYPGQYISEYRAWLLLEKVMGGKVNKHDFDLFMGCQTVEDVMNRLSESEIINALFLNGSQTGLGRLGEFYVSLRCESEWKPSIGYDTYGAFPYGDKVIAGTIEVRTCSPTRDDNWKPRLTGNGKMVMYDVLVVVGMLDSFNPCDAKLFVIPGQVARLESERQMKNNEVRDRPQISIQKNPIYAMRPKWYEYLLVNHSELKTQVSMFVHGIETSVIGQPFQMPLLR